MKQIIKFSSIVMLMCTATIVGHAKSIKIDVKKVRGDLAMELRDLCSTATYNDTVIFNFGKGTYTIDATIDCR